MDGREKKIVFLTSTVHGLVHMQMLVFAAVNIMMAQELGASITAIGFVGTLSYFLFGLGALPAGFVIDAIGARRVIAVCLMGMAAADLMLVFAPSPIWAMSGLALLGLSGSVYHPAGLGLISRNVSKHGLAMGFHGVFGNVGLAMGPLVAGFAAAFLGWRWAYVIVFVPVVMLAAVFFKIRFGDVGEENRHLQPQPSKVFAAGMMAMLMLVILLQSLAGFIYRASLTFLPAHAAQAASEWFSGLDPASRGGLLTGIILLAGAVGQFVAGFLTQRFRTETLLFICALLVAPTLLGLGLMSGMPMLAVGMMFAFVFFAMQPLWNSLVAKYSPPGLRGRSYGLSFFLSFGLGAFGSGFAGWIGETQGFSTVYLWLAGIELFTIAAGVVLVVKAIKNGRRAGGEAGGAG